MVVDLNLKIGEYHLGDILRCFLLGNIQSCDASRPMVQAKTFDGS